jgi:lipid A 3-O-deacylase
MAYNPRSCATRSTVMGWARRAARWITAAVALLLLSALVPAARAADDPPKDPRQLYLFRFEFDNDTFLGSDDAFTAGWSFQPHSRLDDTWHPGYAKWIGRMPGLGDDGSGGRVVRWAAGLGQMIITPKDISIETPQPDDVPWAGVLTAAVSWSAYDNQRMGALQFLVGCMGPRSGAESVQKFQAILGYHLARIPFAFHLTYDRYFGQDRGGIRASSDWVNFSFEYRF